MEKGVSAKFRTTGNSMLPTIRNKDIIVVSPFRARQPKQGDVVAISQGPGCPVIIHRILKIKNKQFLIKGDSCLKYDGLFPRESILGFVSGIERRQKEIPLDKLTAKRNIILSKYRFFYFHRLADRFKRILIISENPSQ